MHQYRAGQCRDSCRSNRRYYSSGHSKQQRYVTALFTWSYRSHSDITPFAIGRYYAPAFRRIVMRQFCSIKKCHWSAACLTSRFGVMCRKLWPAYIVQAASWFFCTDCDENSAFHNCVIAAIPEPLCAAVNLHMKLPKESCCLTWGSDDIAKVKPCVGEWHWSGVCGKRNFWESQTDRTVSE